MIHQKVIYIIYSERLYLSPQRVSAGIMEALKDSRKSTDGEQLKKLLKGKYPGTKIKYPAVNVAFCF